MKNDGWAYLYRNFEKNKQKHMIIGYVYKHPNHEVSDFTSNHILLNILRHY